MSHRLALLALALCAFGIGTTEFAPMGLLSEIASDLHISIPVAGFLISAYAIGVFVGAPVLTLSGLRIPRSSGHPFHEHLTTDSTLIRPPIPRASGH